MLKLTNNPPVADAENLAGKLKGLILGRLALIFLLLVASWWWNTSYLELKEADFPGGLFLIFVLSLALTVPYLLFLRFGRNLRRQVRGQFLIDVVLITGIIWQTGDVVSPYVTLYIILTSVAGFFLSRNETLFLAVLSAAFFSALAVLSAKQLIYTTSDEISSPRFMQIVAFNNVAILIVGLLAGRFSERRRVNEELRETVELFADLHVLHERIVESLRTGLITTDLDGRIYAFNRAAEEISGLPASEVIGASIFSLFGEQIRRFADSSLGSVHENEFRAEHFEAEISNETQRQQVAVACTLAPLVGKTGKVTGMILNFQDLTELRAMEENLRRSDRLAAVGRMAAGLAHEIRNPLGSMSSALQYLQEKVPPATQEAELMEVVLRESDRLNRIITNFLTYARPSADVFARETFAETDVGEAIRDCMMLLKHSPELKANHRLECELPETPIRIKANETQLKQVFWNLSKNSIQAMPDGGRLNIRVRESSGKNVQIVFEDTGAGISPKALEHLFEPFADGARGTGLGLSIVHKIVSDHGGRIDVQSRQQKGTRITVELPQ
ncbi:MAG TPA: ATP-binding protein [Pyrinomonadaceae bacterium]|jgi:two-component system sensor histidine kinase PilS (NtrC family)